MRIRPVGGGGGGTTVTNTVGEIDVVGVPTDSLVTAAGATPTAGMFARDTNTSLVYARSALGVWTTILPLQAADHSQLINLANEDHPQYRKFLVAADGSLLGTATAAAHKWITSRLQPMFADGTTWMALTDGTERFTPVSGRFYGPIVNTSGGSAIAGVGVQRAAPWFLSRRTVFDQIVAHSGTAAVASSVIRPAVWADDGTGKPGALVLDGGSDLSANSTDTDLVQTLASPITLDPGLYHVGGIMNGGPNVRTTNPQNSPFGPALGADTFALAAFAGYTRTPGAGAPSNPFGTGAASATVPAVRLRAQ